MKNKIQLLHSKQITGSDPKKEKKRKEKKKSILKYTVSLPRPPRQWVSEKRKLLLFLRVSLFITF